MRFPDSGRGDGFPVDAAQLAAALGDFTTAVGREFVLDDILRQLAVSATRVLRLAGAGVTTPAEDGGQDGQVDGVRGGSRGEDGPALRVVHATSPLVAELERLQETADTGPCRESLVLHQVINLADLAVEGAWPEYQERAEALGIRALTAIPLLARDRRWGVLDLYRTEAVPLSAGELEAARTLANLAVSYLVVADDRDTARRAQAELAQRAMHDTLTGLVVRWVLLEHLGHALDRLGRSPGQVGVLFLDLDRLKYVNDTYGHAAGDRLIVACTERIRSVLRPADVLARMGGDEFAILLEDVSEVEEAVAVARRILDTLSRPYQPDGHVIHPSASIGIATTDSAATPRATLIAHADAAMYEAKRAGRGNLRVFDPVAYAHHRSSAEDHDQRVQELRDGLAHDRIEVHYQPIIDLAPAGDRGAAESEGPTGKGLYGVEALVRWRHPRHGLVVAGDFLDTAEQAGLLPVIGALVVRRALDQLAGWDRERGPAAPGRLFVNLSPVELAHPDLVTLLQDSLASAGVDAGRLTLEVAESEAVQQPVVQEALIALRGLGCRIAVDDFGTGQSSLSRLVSLPAATIKVDASPSRPTSRPTSPPARRPPSRPTSPPASPSTDPAAARAVVAAVVALGASLGRTVIAERVEDEETLRDVRRLGVRYAQGFHLGRPVPAEDLAHLPAAGAPGHGS